MASTSFTYFYMADTGTTDTSVPRAWRKRRPSSSQAATIVWTAPRPPSATP